MTDAQRKNEEALQLIESVLKGFPNSLAKRDGLAAVFSIRESWQAAEAQQQARIDAALKVLRVLDKEIPKTMGEINLNLLHSDILEAISILAAGGEVR